jgi:hypothetical protein
MLLDNHHGPDPRIQMETEVLGRAGRGVRIIAWDRRPNARDQRTCMDGAETIRLAVAAPPGGGARTAVRMLVFAARVVRNRRVLLADADVLVGHDVYLLPLTVVLSLLCRIPFIYDAHEEWAAMEGNRYPRVLLRAVAGVETWLARRAQTIVVPGDSRVERWTRAGFSRPIVLRNMGAKIESHATAEDPQRWDVFYGGTIADVRRLDLLLMAAERRPSLRVAIAGRGRGADAIQEWAARLPNVTYFGWVEDAQAIARASRSLYYGLDPQHPYAAKACPNTLYQGLALQRPLVFFCGGEPEDLARRYRIGVQCAATPDDLLRAIDTATATTEWQFNEALAAVRATHELDGWARALGEAT